MTDEVESLLRGRRPEPRREFVEQLEDRLMREPPQRRQRLALIVCVVTATAALLVVLGVAGALPLGLGGDQPVRATDRCVTVMVERTGRVPVFVVDRDGKLRVTYRTTRVSRPERRCG